MNAEIPLGPRLLSVAAYVMNTSAGPAFVMKILEPFKTQWSPSGTAVVCWFAALLPTCGSVRQ